MRVAKSVARKNFSQVLERAKRGARVKITHYGRTSAYIVSREDLRKLEACEGRDQAPARRRSRVAARPRRRILD